MYNVSAAFKDKFSSGSRRLKSYVTIGATTYYDDVIVDWKFDDRVSDGDEFMIGQTVANSFSITLNGVTGTFDGAVVKPFVGIETSTDIFEYVPLGTFYVDDIESGDGVITLNCFDGIMKLNKPYVTNLTFPATFSQIVTDLSNQAGVTFYGTVPNFTVSTVPIGYTCRQVAGWIAAIHGANATFNRDNQLTFRQFTDPATDTDLTLDGNNYFEGGLKRLTGSYTIGKVTGVRVDDDSYKLSNGTLPSGSKELVFENLWVNQSIIDNVGTILNGKTYVPFTMEWQGNPALESGDNLQISEFRSDIFKTVCLQNVIYFDGGLSGSAATSLEGSIKNGNTPLNQNAARYMWVKYADDINGTNMTDDPTNKVYMGVAYNKNTTVESTDPAEYSWSLIKGDRGDKGLTGDNGQNAIVGVLSNESHTVPTDVNGNNGNFTGAASTISIFNGTGDDSANWTVTVAVSNVTGSLSGKTYTVTGLSADTGYVDFTAARTGYASIVKRFTLSKSKQGVAGSTPTTYWMVNDAMAIKKNASGVLSPASITVNGKAQTGTASPVAYAGRFIIAEQDSAGTWADKYTSAANESTMSYTPSGNTILAVRVRMYLAGGTTTLLDEQIISVISDGLKGADGSSLYTWIKYADDSAGTNMSDSPTGKVYMGVAYNKSTATESTVAADYSWSLIKGDKGNTGDTGAQGDQGASGINICQNPDFEGDTVGAAPKYWTVYSGTTKGRVANISGMVGANGSGKALEIDAINTGNNDVYQTQLIPVIPSQKFYVEADGWHLNTAGTGNCWVGFRRYGATKNALSNWDAVVQWSTKSTTSSKKTGIFTVPSGCYYLQIWTAFNNNGETTNKFYVDNIRIVPMVTPELLVDGTVEAKHIKSLYGLNVNNKFVVDSVGNVTFSGNLSGASGDFQGNVTAENLIINGYGGNGQQAFFFKLADSFDETIQNGYMIFQSYYTSAVGDASVEIARTYTTDIGEMPVSLADFSIQALSTYLGGSLSVNGGITSQGKNQITAGGEGLKLMAGSTSDHVYMTFFADSQNQPLRSGYFGYGSQGSTTMTLNNEQGRVHIIGTGSDVLVDKLSLTNWSSLNGAKFGLVRDGTATHDRPMLIQNIMVSVPTNNLAQNYIDITFPYAFAAAPTWVLSSTQDANSTVYKSSIYTPTATGCRIYIRHTDATVWNGSVYVHVVACGRM